MKPNTKEGLSDFEIKISPLYQAIRDFTSGVIHVGDPVAFSFEHFMNWIEKLRIALLKNSYTPIN